MTQMEIKFIMVNSLIKIQKKEKIKNIKYEGDFLEGKYNGYGTLYGGGIITNKNTKLYEGQFKEGIYHELIKYMKIII